MMSVRLCVSQPKEIAYKTGQPNWIKPSLIQCAKCQTCIATTANNDIWREYESSHQSQYAVVRRRSEEAQHLRIAKKLLSSGSYQRSLIPLALFTLSVCVFVYVASLQKQQQQAHLAADTTLALEQFATRLSTLIATRLQTAQIIEQHLSEHPTIDRTTFVEEATNFHNLFDDIQAINWVDRTGIIKFVTPIAGNEAAVDLNLRNLPLPSRALNLAEETGTLHVTPPLELAQGGLGFVAYVPVVKDTKLHGFVNIVFRIDALVDSAHSKIRQEDFQFSIRDANTALFGDKTSSAQNPYTVLQTISVGTRSWVISASPTGERVTGSQTPVDEAILIGGLLASIALAVLSHLLIKNQLHLSDSQNRLRTFAAASSDWFWEMDDSLEITWFSRGIESFFGIPREELLGRTRQSFRESADDEEQWQAHLSDLKSHKAFRDFVYAVRVNDQRKWVRVSGTPKYDTSGTFSGYMGAAADVTELVNARISIEDANNRLFTAVEDLNEMFSLWDEEDRLVFGNKFFRDLNQSIADLLRPGLPFETYLRAGIESGDFMNYGTDADEFIRTSLENRYDVDSTPFDIERTDGTILRLSEQKLPSGGIVTTGLDVTKEKRAEIALKASEKRLALASQHVSIWDWDLEKNVVFLPDSFRENLGYSKEEFESIKADSIASLIHPDDIDSYRAKLEQHLQKPSTVFESEHRFVTKSGESKWYLATGQAESNSSGIATRSTGILTDITERKNLEIQLRQNQKLEAIGRLTGGIAHDFNNLLAVVLGSLELVIDDIKDPDVGDLLNSAMSATMRGADLVKHLLGFARQTKLSPIDLSVSELISELSSWTKRVLPESINVEFDIDPNAGYIRVDRTIAQNAVLNLILNSKDAMGKGGNLSISVEKTRVEPAQELQKDPDLPEGDYVVISVRDNGVGIQKEHLEVIFEPFFTTKSVGEGSGLGLSMVHGFMQQSGGKVTVESKPGVGTTVFLYFPALDRAESSIVDISNSTDQRLRHGNHVLLVEDEGEVLSVLKKILELGGFKVTSATSGAEGIAQWDDKKAHIDLVITDIVMPGDMQGPDFASEIRKTNPLVPIIFLSGYATENSFSDVSYIENADFLLKPISKKALLDAASKAIARD